MKAKEVKRVLALSMAITLAAPVNALAAGPESGLDEGQIIEGQELSEGGTPEGETPGGEIPEGETPEGETPGGETPEGETPEGETPGGETPEGEIPGGETPGGETPEGETPGGETPEGEIPGGETPEGETPGGETPEGEIPGGETPGSDETPGGETPEGETPGSDETPGEETPGGETSGEEETPGSGETPGEVEPENPETPEETPETPEEEIPESPEEEIPENPVETPEEETPEVPEETPETPEEETPEEPEEEKPQQPEQEIPDSKPQQKPEEEKPSTETPEEEKPSTETPEEEKPSTETPEEEEPSTETPEEEEPSTEVPEEEKPSTEQPEAPETPETPAETPEEETPQEPETEEVPETPQEEIPAQETPEEYEARTGYQLPEGRQYVLENGYIVLMENGAPLTEAVEEQRDSVPASNEELVAQQQFYEIPVMVEDFRFWTVARKYAFAKLDISVREEMTDEARAVGSLATQGLCYILQEEENGWLYVESGTVRGFVKAEELYTGDEAQEILEAYQKAAKEKAEQEQTEYTGIETVAPIAQELVPRTENAAFLHTRSTVNRTVVDKDYAVTTASLLNVREGKGTDTRIVGTLPNNSLCYILADKDTDWVYIESGDVRGFVSREYIQYGEETTQYVDTMGEDNFTKADKLIEPEENGACYYTLTSIKSGVPGGEMRSSVVEFASQFIGNPYVWGGTSLTDGADCSGFVQSVYRQYGYELPRVAEDQAQYGTKIAVEDARPGDLIFYARDGYIYHVVIYAGDGKTVEAMGTNYGIVQGNVNYGNAVWATRILDDTQMVYGSGDIAEVNATEDMYGDYLGNFKLTYYCSCEICCDVETGITATGTPVIEGQTIAVDPSVIPYGTQVIINGHVFTAEDCGGAIKGNRIDIYVDDHDRANALGVNYADVYLMR